MWWLPAMTAVKKNGVDATPGTVAPPPSPAGSPDSPIRKLIPVFPFPLSRRQGPYFAFTPDIGPPSSPSSATIIPKGPRVIGDFNRRRGGTDDQVDPKLGWGSETLPERYFPRCSLVMTSRSSGRHRNHHGQVCSLWSGTLQSCLSRRLQNRTGSRSHCQGALLGAFCLAVGPLFFLLSGPGTPGYAARLSPLSEKGVYPHS